MRIETFFYDFGIKFEDPASLFLFFNYLFLPLFGVAILVWLNNLLFRPKRTFGSKYSRLGKSKIWVLSSLALLMIVLAYAQPYTDKPVIKFHKGNVELVVVIDNSFSMWSPDLGQPRVEVAAREILDLGNGGILVEGDRASLFTVAKSSMAKVMLTTNLERFYTEVSRINVPLSLKGKGESHWGTQISAGLQYALDLIDAQDKFYLSNPRSWRPVRKSNRLALVLTDGDLQLSKSETDSSGKNEYQVFMEHMSKVLSEYRLRGIKIYGVGIGTSQGYLLTDLLKKYQKGSCEEVDRGEADYCQQDADDLKDVRSTLNVSTLKILADSTGGDYRVITGQTENAQSFLKWVIDSHRASVVDKSATSEKNELWPQFVLIALALMALGFIFY